MPIRWCVFPKSMKATSGMLAIVLSFEQRESNLSSLDNDLSSDQVLSLVADDLAAQGFQVERSKSASDKVKIPVLYGEWNRVEKAFEADAFLSSEGLVVEIEAGRGVVNHQFLKDLFEACMMQEARHLAICIRQAYRGAKDYETVVKFFETLYASDRLRLPLASILILGY